LKTQKKDFGSEKDPSDSDKKNKHILTIGIDIDNTVCDSYSAYLPVYNKELDMDIKYWEIEDFYNLGLKYNVAVSEVQAVFWKQFQNDNFQLSLKPYKQAQGVIGRWIKQGYKLHYITGRPHTSEKVTRHWLVKNGFWSRNATLNLIHLSRFGEDISFKKDIAEKLGLDVIIEDHRGVVNNIRIPAILLDRPWNRGFIAPNVMRVKTWMEIEKIVSGYRKLETGNFLI
jgi:uncharacterized HAD superfamily protein